MVDQQPEQPVGAAFFPLYGPRRAIRLNFPSHPGTNVQSNQWSVPQHPIFDGVRIRCFRAVFDVLSGVLGPSYSVLGFRSVM
jgi:hypothetical protein